MIFYYKYGLSSHTSIHVFLFYFNHKAANKHVLGKANNFSFRHNNMMQNTTVLIMFGGHPLRY